MLLFLTVLRVFCSAYIKFHDFTNPLNAAAARSRTRFIQHAVLSELSTRHVRADTDVKL